MLLAEFTPDHAMLISSIIIPIFFIVHIWVWFQDKKEDEKIRQINHEIIVEQIRKERESHP